MSETLKSTILFTESTILGTHTLADLIPLKILSVPVFYFPLATAAGTLIPAKHELKMIWLKQKVYLFAATERKMMLKQIFQ